jgi:hypothetical protein
MDIISNIIFFLSIIFMVIGFTRQNTPKPNQVIRYIPRSLEEEEKEPVKAEKIFKSMFEQQAPWIGTYNDNNVIERRELDKSRGIFDPNKN